jgi:hypothetical protein
MLVFVKRLPDGSHGKSHAAGWVVAELLQGCKNCVQRESQALLVDLLKRAYKILMGVAAMSKIKRVVLYKHGVGHFERQAEITGDGEVRLAFRTEEMNDVLKSLTVYDNGGGSVSSVSYDNKKPISKLLSDISLDIPSTGGSVELLGNIRGAEVGVTVGSRTVEGQIVGVDRRVAVNQGQPCERHLLTIFDDKGRLQTFDLDEVTNVAFQDEDLQNDMRFLFATVFSAMKQDAKSLKVFSRGEGERTLSISYVVECPVWKTSYRVALPAEESDTQAFLQGWALVDNPQDEDWKDVQLSLVSGLPISFRHDLYSPRYKTRKEVEVETEAAAGPVMTEGDMLFDCLLEEEAGGEDLFGGGGPVPAAGMALSAPAPRMKKRASFADKSAVKVETVTQKTGQLFEYKIDRPVTVLRNQSALVPIVAGDFEGGKTLLYNESQRAENPFSVVDFKNTTGLTLEGGPVTVYEGEIYAGEAMMDTLAPGEERMLPYSVALEVEVKVEREHSTKAVQQTVGMSVWRKKEAHYSVTRYRFVNKGGEPKTVILEHPLSKAELVNTPKPASETRSFWRFQVEIPAGGKETLEITEKMVVEDVMSFTNYRPEQIMIVLDGMASETEKNPLVEELRKLLTSINDINKRHDILKTQKHELVNGQNRIRENLKSLGTTEEERRLRSRYVGQLDTEETRLTEITSQMNTLAASVQAARKTFYDKAKELTLERVYE